MFTHYKQMFSFDEKNYIHSLTKILICGYYGEDNLGDDALLQLIINNLPENTKPYVLYGKEIQPKNIAKEIYYLLSEEGKAAWKQNRALLVNSIDTTRKNPYQNAAKYILQ